MKHKIFAVSALALALAACDDNDVTASTNNVEGTVEIGGISASGIPFIGDELSANVADANGLESSTVIAYQWMADGTAIAGATSAEYTVAEANDGSAITVSAAYIDNDDFNESIVSVATELVTPAPVDVAGTVDIDGIEEVGETLTATLVDDNGVSATVEYQWFRAGTAIEGATNRVYDLVVADEAQTLTVQVSYTDDAGFVTESLESTATGVIAPEPIPLGVLTQVARISDTIGVVRGATRNDDTGPVNTGELRLNLSQQDGSVEPLFVAPILTGRMTVTFSKETLQSLNPVSDDVEFAAAAFIAVLGASTSGEDAIVDLRIDNAFADTAEAVNYEIRNADFRITNTAYVPNDVVEVEITWDGTGATSAPGFDSDGDSIDVISGYDVAVFIDGVQVTPPDFSSTSVNFADVDGGAETIQFRLGDNDEILNGDFLVDDIRLYNNGTLVFSDDFETYTEDFELASGTDTPYNNNTSEAVVASFELPTDAVEATLTTARAAAIQAIVDQLAIESATPVVDVAGEVEISGSEIVNSTLTATVSDDNGVDFNTVTYQWLRDGTAITGETASTYTLVDADEGLTLTVEVSYTDNDAFVTADLASAATGTIAPAPVASASISGLAVSIADTGSDTGEIRGSIPTTEIGSISLNFSRGEIFRTGSTTNAQTVVALFGSSTSSDNGLINLEMRSDGSLQIRNNGGSITVNQGYNLDADNTLEITWDASAADTTTAPIMSVTINGVQLTDTATFESTVEGSSTSDAVDSGTGLPASALNTVQDGVQVIQVRNGDNSNTSSGAIIVDNIVVTSIVGGVSTDIVTETFDGTGTFVNPAIAADTLVTSDNSNFESQTVDATIVDTGL